MPGMPGGAMPGGMPGTDMGMMPPVVRCLECLVVQCPAECLALIWV